MTIEELFSVQKDQNKLQSLYMELARHEDFNPYKNNVISDMPKGSGGMNFNEWYTERKEHLLSQIELYKKKVQEDKAILDEYIDIAPYPECDIIRYKIINNCGWQDIGAYIGISGRTAERKFWKYLKMSKMSKLSEASVC